MAGPVTPIVQPFIASNWLGTTIGSVSPGRFVTHSGDSLVLWRVTDTGAVQLKTVPVDFSVAGVAENDNGIIALYGWSSSLGNVATVVSPTLGYDLFQIPFTPDQMYVSGDGLELVFFVYEYNVVNAESDVHLYGYSLAGRLNWDFVIDTSTNIHYGQRPRGHIAGVPRAERVVWVNTTITEYLDDTTSAIFSGGGVGVGASWTLSGNMPDPLPWSILSMSVIFNLTWSGRGEYGYSWDHPWPSYETGVQTPYINGVEASPVNLNVGYWTDGFYVENSAGMNVTPPGAGEPFSYTLTIDPFYGPDWNEWWAANYFYSYGYHGGAKINIMYDVSELGGGTIELRNDFGAVIDAIPIPASGGTDQWIGTGSDTLTAFYVAGMAGT